MKANGCNNDSQDMIRIEVEKRSIRKRQLSHRYQSGHRKQDWQNTYYQLDPRPSDTVPALIV